MNTILVVDIDKVDLEGLDLDTLKSRYLHIRKILSEQDVTTQEAGILHTELDRVLLEINGRLDVPGPTI